MIRLAFLMVLLGLSCSPSTLPHEGKSVPELCRLLDQPDASAQTQAALGLGLHGPRAAQAVPRLQHLLASPDPLVRQQCALALGKIGPDARSAVPALVPLLRDPDWALRRQVALALGTIGDPSCLSELQKHQTDENRLVRQAIQQSIRQLRGAQK